MMCMLLPRVAVAQELDGTFTITDLASNPSGTYFDVGVSSTTIYTAYNMDLFLPVGINVALDGNSKPKVQMLKTSAAVYPATVTQVWDDELEDYKEVTTYTHSVSCSQPTANQLRVACISNINEDFTKTSGKLFRVYVTLDNTVLAASFSPKPIVKLSGLNLTTSSEVKYVPADFSCRPFTTGIPTERTLAVNVSSTNKIGTLILPFNADLPTGLKAYSCNAIGEGDLLTLTQASSIEACTPYIVYAENGYSGNLSGTASLTDATNVTDVFTDGYLTGVLTTATTNNGYVLQNQGSGPMFYDTDGATFSIPAGRCYLTPSASNNVKSFGFNFDIETAIQDELINCKSSNCKLLYDLSGRRVESPTRGIYIQGTRKVIIK